MEGEIVERTVSAILEELARSPWRGIPAKTIFFGGGTPTFLSEDQIERLLAGVMEAHPPIEGAEITSEANPGTIDGPKFAAMRRAGFNRLSLGVQSFVDEDLRQLGRVHSSGDVERAVGLAREAGFENLNLDLMFGLPRQGLDGWRRNLERALDLAPKHLSLYCLTLEPNTEFFKLAKRGLLELPDDDVQVEMFEMCLAETSARGMRQYEISNFAFPGFECRHNLAYWRAEDYAGYGPGAVGTMDGVRRTNWKHPLRYCEAIESGAASWHEEEPLDESAIRTERLMLGLRLVEGIDVSELAPSEKGLARTLEREWIWRSGERVGLTEKGRSFCSEVALELIG